MNRNINAGTRPQIEPPPRQPTSDWKVGGVQRSGRSGLAPVARQLRKFDPCNTLPRDDVTMRPACESQLERRLFIIAEMAIAGVEREPWGGAAKEFVVIPSAR